MIRRSFVAVVVAIVLSSTVMGQEKPVDRFWGEFEIARLAIRVVPFDGGVGGFRTEWVPLTAQAVVKVQEGQEFTWEWLGVTAPGTAELKGFPNVSFDLSSDETFEYRANAYLQIGPFHEVIYGQETDQPEFVSSGLEGIRSRIVRV